ncbi:MAG: glycine--tRNA ligase subunit beta, partial [Candidatus Binataceae bacterium]
MISKASQELKAILEKSFLASGLLEADEASAALEVFGAPRRLTAIARGVRLKQEDVTREITGPPKLVAFDSVGAPTRAAQSFAEKQGIRVSDLKIISTPKGEYLAAVQLTRGQPAEKILAEILLQAIHDISWPRSMYWTGAQGPRFIRPIRWIVALLDGKIVPFTFAEVQAGNHTEGHRFLGREKIQVSSPRDYEEKLKKNFVLCRPEARRKKIEAEIRPLASRQKLRAHPDEELLSLVANLNEYPTA